MLDKLLWWDIPKPCQTPECMVSFDTCHTCHCPFARLIVVDQALDGSKDHRGVSEAEVRRLVASRTAQKGSALQ
jgi:hypothetical protein